MLDIRTEGLGWHSSCDTVHLKLVPCRACPTLSWQYTAHPHCTMCSSITTWWQKLKISAHHPKGVHFSGITEKCKFSWLVFLETSNTNRNLIENVVCYITVFFCVQDTCLQSYTFWICPHSRDQNASDFLFFSFKKTTIYWKWPKLRS